MAIPQNDDKTAKKKKLQEREIVVANDNSENGCHIASAKHAKKRKTVAFSEADAATQPSGDSQPSSAKPKPPILKKRASLSNDVDDHQDETPLANGVPGDAEKKVSSKPKKSKNVLKRIKWRKRHIKKTQSKSERKANLQLARSRPSRTAQNRLTEAIDYLNAWYTTPETWKYKKVAQLTLIKHAFNEKLIDEESFTLLLHYLAGVQGGAADRLRALCQHLIDNNGAAPEEPSFPIVLPDDPVETIVERAKRMLEFVVQSAQET